MRIATRDRLKKRGWMAKTSKKRNGALFVGLFLLACIVPFNAGASVAPDPYFPTGHGPLVCRDDRISTTGSCSSGSYQGYMRKDDFIAYMQVLGFVNDPDYVPGGGGESGGTTELDTELISLIVGGCLLMWATGCGVGMSIKMVRKMR